MKAKLIRILIAAALLAVAYVIERTGALPMWQLLLVYLVPYFVAGYDVVGEALEGLAHGHPFDENFLMVVATLGALCIGFLPGGEPQLPEAVFVMLFFQVGELFEGYAEGRSRRSIKSLMQIRPDTATVERGGRALTVPAAEVKKGETMVVSAGERIALDGTVTDGTTSLNTVALTGESLPRDVGVGDEVYSGTINLQGLIKVRVSKTFGESTASRIIDLVEHASESKSKSEAFITKFARIYTPVVVGAAVLLALVPPLFVAGSYADALPTWLLRALIFLVVSCPCALVLSVPLSFFGGIGGASRRGILVKGGNYMETLARTGTVVFDKTGTLTRGRFSVTAVHPECVDEQKLLHLAAHVERFSTHPIAISLRNAYPNEADHCHVDDIEEIAGRGVRGQVNGHTVCVGNEQMMDDVGATWHPCHEAGTIVHVSMDGEYLGHIVISDELKPDAARAVQELKALGVERTVMLTGDHEEVAADVARRVGVDEYAARLLPADKVARVERLLTEKPAGRTLAFVGDGINDAPVLARADVGIAMGGMGSDAAIEAADVVLMDDQPSKIPVAIRLARHTVLNARENVVFAIAVKLTILMLAAAGVAGMPLAVFGDVGVMVICVLNAARTLRA